MTSDDKTKSAEAKKTKRYIEVSESWPLRKGKNEWLGHLNNQATTRKEAMLAKCYDCMGGYEAVGDCGVVTCALHPWMPYREGGPRTREMSEEQRVAAVERLKKAREKAECPPVSL